MRDGGDAEPVLPHDPLLGPLQRQRTDGRIDRPRAERPRELAEAGGEQCVEIGVRVQVVLMRGDLAAVRGGADPDADELRDLLLEGHLGGQRSGTVGHRHRDIAPWRSGLAIGHAVPP